MKNQTNFLPFNLLLVKPLNSWTLKPFNSKIVAFILFNFLTFKLVLGQNVSINQGGALPDGTAMLDITSTTKGLLIPRMTFLQRTLILLPANSLLIYQTNSSPGYYYNSGTALLPVWVKLATNPDNLGNHIATQNIELNGNYFSNDSDDEGITIDNDGNVGIGLSLPNNPNARLQIVESVAASNNNGTFIDIQNSGANTNCLSGIRFKNSLTTSNTRYQAAIWHRFNSGSTDFQLNFAVRDNSASTNVDTADIKMTINNSGRVGIGTTKPAEKLEIAGNLIFSEGVTRTISVADRTVSSMNGNTLFLKAGNGGPGGTGVSGGGVTIQAGDAYNNLGAGNGGSIRLIAGGNTLTNDDHGDIIFSTRDQITSVERARIDGTNGNFGIGITTPARSLHVHSSGALSLSAHTTLATGSNVNDGLAIGYVDAIGATIFNNENSNLAFGVNGLYRMWLSPNGDLGVGEINPGARLHLSGTSLATAIIESSNTSGTWTVWRNSSTGGKYHQIISTGSTNSEGAGKMLFGYGNAASTVNGIAMTIEDSEVGIGTSSPATVFHVNHPTGIANGFSLSNASGGTDRWHFYVYTSDDLTLFFNGNSRGSFDDVTGTYSSTSDFRLKKNISLSASILDKVNKLQVKEYHYKTQSDNEQKTIGFIAQELEKEFPSLVTHANSDGDDTYLVNYSGLGTIAIKAIQEQQEIINILEKRLIQLEKELKNLKNGE